MHKAVTSAFIAATLSALSAGALGADRFPSKPVRLIVPFAAGGNVDIVTRVIARNLSEKIGQQVVVDNRGGAGGAIGTELVAQAPSDGYTLLMVTASHVTNPSLRKLPYNTEKDFSAISIVAEVPVILVVHPSLPVRSVNDLIALAKAKPGQLNFGSGGKGTGAHLAAELLKSAAGINIVHIPYKGIGLALIDLLGGQIQMMFSAMPSVMPHVLQKRLRPLGVAAAKRSPALPEVPTILETGLPGVEASVSFTLLAPAATPGKTIAFLNEEIVKTLRAPEVHGQLVAKGAIPVGSTPAEAAQFVTSEIIRWTRVTKALGLSIN